MACRYCASDRERADQLARAPTREASSTSDYPTPAQRPAYSCLDTSALRERFGISLPDWREGVTQTLAELAGC